jgi:hypothetical protein
MIYKEVDLAEPLSQGDIFLAVPSIRISLQDMICADEDGDRIVRWEAIVAKGESPTCLFEAAPVPAIVVTPDCDALRSELITLAEIRTFAEVEGKAKSANSPKAFMKIITQHARINQKWFYLPQDDTEPFRRLFKGKMGVDFRATLSLPRTDLEKVRTLRIARLDTPAIEHFRERISEFYRRYPYDEWYPLDAAEFEKYISSQKQEEIDPYPWQRQEENQR